MSLSIPGVMSLAGCSRSRRVIGRLCGRGAVVEGEKTDEAGW